MRQPIRRGEILGKRVGGEPADEADHFIKCTACGGWIDCRDLGQVLEHEGPLPHPAADGVQSRRRESASVQCLGRNC